jgi:hypothetical protein
MLRINLQIKAFPLQAMQFLLTLYKKVVWREEGMGLKIIKFHVWLHLIDDILDFGVPLNWDSSPTEHNHQKTKLASKRTQKCKRTFDLQTARSVWSDHVMETAACHIQQSKEQEDNSEEEVEHEEEDAAEDEGIPMIFNTGSRFQVMRDENGEPNCVAAKGSRMKNPEGIVQDQQLLDYLCEELIDNIPEWSQLTIFTEHKRNGQIFRSHPEYKESGVWKDWVSVEFGVGRKHQEVACHIQAFVDLRELPAAPPLMIAGTNKIPPGSYAVVEYSEQDDREIASELWLPIKKEVASLKPELKRKYHLVDVEAFAAPLVVVPDIGGAPNAYFQLKEPRNGWAKLYSQFIWSITKEQLANVNSDSEESSSSEDDDDGSAVESSGSDSSNTQEE